MAGHEDGADDGSRIVLFKPTANLFKGKDNASNRRVEGCSNSGTAAAKDKSPSYQVLLKASHLCNQVHTARAHVHGRAFATNRHTGKQANGQQQHLAQRDAQ